MRVSPGLPRTQVTAITAAGLIAMPVAMLPGHSAPATSATAQASASSPASASAPASASEPARATTARPPAGPRLSISVTDGQTAVKPGQQLTYLVRVQNSGMLGEPRLKITQTLPAGLTFGLAPLGYAGAALGALALGALAVLVGRRMRPRHRAG